MLAEVARCYSINLFWVADVGLNIAIQFEFKSWHCLQTASSKSQLSNFAYNEMQMPPDFEKARLALSDKNLMVVRNLNTQRIAGYTWLKDTCGKSILLMRVVKDRELY